MGVKSRIAEAYLQIVPTFGDLKSNLNKELNGMDKHGTAAGSSIGNGMKSGMLGALKGIAGPLTAAIGIGAIVSGAKKSLESLARIEVINTQTETVIKSMGNAAGISAKQVEDLAGALERKTATEAESIQSGANMLLTFGNIKNEVGAGNDVFNQATGIMVDMSRALGQDTTQSAMQLGKALNDPIAGVGALRRVGVAFTEDQQKMIESLVESGDVMGAQKIILGELNKEFGGQGEAYAQTFSGTIDLIKHEMGTIGETLMGTAMPGLNTFAKAGLGLLQNFVDNLPGILETVGTAVGPLISSFMELWKTMSPFSVLGQALIPILMDLAKQLGPVLTNIIQTILPVITELSTIIGGVLSQVFTALAPILAEIIMALADALVPIFNQLAPILVQVAQFVGNLIIQLLPLITAVLGLVAPLITALSPILQIIISLLQYLLPPIMAIIQVIVAVLIPVIQLVVAAFQIWISIIGTIYKAFADAFSNLPAFFKGVVNSILGFVEGFINFFIDGINGIIGKINELAKGVKDATNGTINLQVGYLGKVNIPRLAKGGYVDSPTTALIGEAGPEVVTPLADFKQMMGLSDGTQSNNQNILNYNNYAPQGLGSQEQLNNAFKVAQVRAGW